MLKALCKSPDIRRLRHQHFLIVYLPVLKKLVFWLFPTRLRRSFVGIFRHLILPASNPKRSSPIYIVGFFSSAIGQGEGARLTAEAMRQLGYSTREIDVGQHFGLQDFDGIDHAPLMEKGRGTIIFHFNPDALVFSLLGAGRAALSDKRRVGYWAWETTKIPETWVDVVPYLDEIWVPSEFVAAAVRRSCAKPVHVVPHPVGIMSSGVKDRGFFGIVEDVTVVLSMASFHSTFDRKNLLGAVDAFREAFGNDRHVLLILKVAHSSDRTLKQQEELRARINGVSNIRLLDGIFTTQQVRNLIASVDILLSLHRSEGFGLVLAEAMQSGTAVIATDWSGNKDFMDERTAAMVPATMVPALDSQGFFTDPEVQWAEPSIASAVHSLKRLVDEPSFRTEMAARAQSRVNRELGLEGFERALTLALGFGPDNKA